MLRRIVISGLTALLCLAGALVSPPAQAVPMTDAPLLCTGDYWNYVYPDGSGKNALSVDLYCGTEHVYFLGNGPGDPAFDPCPGGGEHALTLSGSMYSNYGTPVPAEWTVTVHNGVSVLSGHDDSGRSWSGLASYEPVDYRPVCSPQFSSSTVTAFQSGERYALPTPLLCQLTGVQKATTLGYHLEQHAAVAMSGTCKAGTDTLQIAFQGEWFHLGGVTGSCNGLFDGRVAFTDPASGWSFVQSQNWFQQPGQRQRRIEVETSAAVLGTATIGAGLEQLASAPCDITHDRALRVTLAFVLLR